jgi:hypothetical protein
LVRGIFQELGYEVVDAKLDSQEGKVDFSIRVPAGTNLTALKQEVQRRMETKVSKQDTRGLWGGFAAGILFALLGSVAHRRSLAVQQRKSPARRQRAKTRPRQARGVVLENNHMPRQALVPGRHFQPIQPPSWEEVIESIPAKLLLVKDLSVRTELIEELERLHDEKRERVPKARYLLWRIEEAIAERAAAPPLRSGAKEPEEAAPSREKILNLRDLLPIEDVLPRHVDPILIKDILLGFMQPGSQVPFFEGSYTGTEQFRRHTGLPAKELERGLRYLRSIGLVRQRRRKIHGRVLLSLNTKALTSPAREIAQLVLQARRSIEQGEILVH